MKKGLNIIQIKGFRGILLIALIGCCLVAGFVWFPSWCCVKLWNLCAGFIDRLPAIGIIQGILLWGILIASYFTFRKEKVVVCMRAEEGLNEEELKEVFSNIKQQAYDDKLLANMIKARIAELRIKNLSDANIPPSESKSETTEKIETK
jgi:hypothetical protein